MSACKSKNILTIAVAVLAMAFSTALAQTKPAAAQNPAGNVYPALLEQIDAFSPAAPDAKVMAAIYKFRAQAQDDELRALLDTFTATGLIALNRADLYKGGVKPVMANAGEFEGTCLIKCKKCNGSGKEEFECKKCGGTGQCVGCNGAGKKRVNVALRGMKGPTKANEKSKDDPFAEVTCDFCKGTGNCQSCGGEGKKDHPCPTCGGAAKVWDTASMAKNLAPAYEKLRSAVQSRNFEAKIPLAIATAKTDAGTVYGPVFAFGGTKVAAVPARALTAISEFKLTSSSKDALPVAGILAAKDRDLILVDLGDIPLVNLLTLEADYKQLVADKPIYAYGFSREGESSVRFGGKITDAGPQNLITTIDTEKIADGAPLISDGGNLAGIFMFPVAERNSLGIPTLSQTVGAAVRFDNLKKADFTALSVEDLRQRNSALTFAQRAIKAASDMLGLDMDTLKTKREDISETIKRLERAIAMVKGVKSWDVFMMAETANELVKDASTRAANLEALFEKITTYEADQKQKAEDDAAAAKAALEVEAVKALPEETPAAVDATPPPRKTKKPRSEWDDDDDDGKDAGELDLLKVVNWRKVGIIAAVVIVLLTVIFILIGVVQDKMRQKKLSAPPVIPDFIREMQEYERKHPQKK